MFVAVLLAISVAVNFALARLLARSIERLMQFDDVFQQILPPLEEYSNDLIRMSSGDLDGAIVDHPEILEFHRRNMLARAAVISVVDSVTRMTPPRKKKTRVRLPRPDME